MTKIFRTFMISILVFGLALAGCDKRKSVERDDLSFSALNSEEIFSEGDYPQLANLVGNISFRDLLSTLQDSMDKLNALAKQGYASKSDYQTLVNIISNVYVMMDEYRQDYELAGAEESALSEASQSLINILGALVEDVNNPGHLLNSLIEQTGPDFVVQNVYPLLVYALAAQDDILKNLGGGVQVSGFESYDDFKSVVSFAGSLLEKDVVSELLDALKTNAIKDLTIQDVIDLLADIMDAQDESEEVSEPEILSEISYEDILTNVASALDDLWNAEDGQFKTDLAIILHETGCLMASDKDGQTDFARILGTLIRVLDPNNSDNLQEFVRSALHGVQGISSGETLQGVVARIAGTDTDHDGILDVMNDYSAGGIGEGLLMSVTHNMYGQLRTGSVAEVKASSLRSLMYLMQEANTIPDLLGIPQLALIISPDGGTAGGDGIYNIAIWTVGEIVNSVQDGRTWSSDHSQCDWMEAADDNGNGIVDIYEAIDWTFYTKTYNLAGLGNPLFGLYDGIVGMLADPLVQALMPPGVVQTFASLVELAGGQADEDEEGIIKFAFRRREDTAGQRHKLFGLFAPLMEYFWDPQGDGSSAENQRVSDMIRLLVNLSEIGCDPAQNPYISYADDYISVNKTNGSFVTDSYPSFMRIIDGGENFDGGMLAYALRSHDGFNADGMLVDSAVDMIARVVFALNSSASVMSNGRTTFQNLMDKLDIHAMSDADIEEIIEKLFTGEDGEEPLIGTIYNKLSDNQDALAAICKPMGKMLMDIDTEKMGDAAGALWPMVEDMLGGDENSESTLGDLIDYLKADNADGSENPFVFNAKTLAYKILDIQDATYNAAGKLPVTTALTGPDSLIAHLLRVGAADNGNTALYDIEPLMNVLSTITGSDALIFDLWTIMNEGGDMLEEIMGDEELTLSFVRSLMTNVDSNSDQILEDSVVLGILQAVHLENVDMYELLLEVNDLLSGVDLKPGSDTFTNLLNTIAFLVNNSVVQ